MKPPQCRFQPRPGRQRTPTGGASASRLPPFLPFLTGAHKGATAPQLPKGNAERHASKKTSSLCELVILNRYFHLPRSKSRRPAAPGMKVPACPSVSVGHQIPVPMRRCTVPPCCPTSHVFAPHTPLQPLPPLPPWRTCSCTALSLSPPRRPVHLGATSDAGLWCAVAPGLPLALLHRHRRRRSPTEPVEPEIGRAHV